MIWLLISIISVLVILALIAPFMRQEKQKASDGLAVFSGQLDELKRDRELDLISEEEARAAELEIKRRLLAASSAMEEEGQASSSLRQISVVSVSMSAIIAVAMYLVMGSPHLVGNQPDTPQAAEMPEELRAVIEEIDALASQLMEHPDNLEGWVVLGQSYMALRRYREASVAFENAIDLIGDDAVLQASLGQAYLFAEGGRMTPIAREAFARALDIDPSNMRARFFMAEAHYQSGNVEEALSQWRAMLEDESADASIQDMIQGRLTAAIRDQESSD